MRIISWTGRFGGLAFLWQLLFPVALFASTPWYVPYERALDAQQSGHWTESVEFLRQALQDRPEPKAKAKTYGLRFVNYLPYYYMGVAFINLGDTANAVKNFKLSEKHGAIQDAPDELQDLQAAMAALTGKAPAVAVIRPEPPSEPSTEPATESAPVDDSSPWYVSYETGLEYFESGDWAKAVDNLQRSVVMRKEPEQYARTYGMWFISYLPYYYLGVALYNQGLWRAAQERLLEAEKNSVIQKFPQEYARLQELLAALKSKVVETSSNPKRLKDILNTRIVEAVRTFNEEEYDAAERQFNEILMLDPYNSVAKSYLMRLAGLKSGEKQEGDDFLAGVSEFSKGNFRKAAELLTLAADREETNPRIAAYLGASYGELYLASKKKDKESLRKANEQFSRVRSLSARFTLDPRVFSPGVIRLSNESLKQRK